MERISLSVTVKDNTHTKHRKGRTTQHHQRALRANERIEDNNVEEKIVSKLSQNAVNAQKILQMASGDDNDRKIEKNKHNPSRIKKSSSRDKTITIVVKNSKSSVKVGDIKDYEERDPDNTSLSNTIAEAREAVNDIKEEFNRIEREEKSKNLEERAISNELKLNELSEDLRNVTLKRIRHCLETPNSAISSTDAKIYLESLNNASDKKPSVVGKMINKVKKNNASNNDTILALENAEEKCFAKISENSKLIDKANAQKQNLSNAKIKAKEARKAEEKARKALIAAEEYTISCNKALKESEIFLSEAKMELDKSTDEVNKLSKTLEQQQEKVRKYLLKKEKSLIKSSDTIHKDNNDSVPSIVTATIVEQDEANLCCTPPSSIDKESDVTLEELKEEEEILEAEFKKLEDRLLYIKSKRESLPPPSSKLYSC